MVSEATDGRKKLSLNVLSGIIDYDMHHGTMVRITLESSSPGNQSTPLQNTKGSCSKSRTSPVAQVRGRL